MLDPQEKGGTEARGRSSGAGEAERVSVIHKVHGEPSYLGYDGCMPGTENTKCI